MPLAKYPTVILRKLAANRPNTQPSYVPKLFEKLTQAAASVPLRIQLPGCRQSSEGGNPVRTKLLPAWIARLTVQMDSRFRGTDCVRESLGKGGGRDAQKTRNEGKSHDVIDNKGPIWGTHDAYEIAGAYSSEGNVKSQSFSGCVDSFVACGLAVRRAAGQSRCRSLAPSKHLCPGGRAVLGSDRW